jgi:DNA-binding CsgD family transcriptional regulator
MMMALPPEERVRMLRWCGGRTASQQFRMREREFLEHPASRDVWQPKGYADCLALNSCDVSGRGAYVAAPIKRPRWVTGARARRWTRIAAHFATGLRLRTALMEVAPSTDLFTHGDAVLSPRGKIEHAERDAREKGAREALRAAAITIDRARGSLRECPDDALASWAPLVSGRWSVVDRFDRDGRRYLIALPNAPHLDDPRALTAQERVVVAFASLGHTNKMIAYDLGISVSRVGTLLSCAARKLGARSRVELVTLASSLASQKTS